MTEAMRELLVRLAVILGLALVALWWVGQEHAGGVLAAAGTYIIGYMQRQPDLIRDRKAKR